MNRRAVCIALGLVAQALSNQAEAARIPAGTDLSVRLIDKVATETTKPATAIHATVIVPVIVEEVIAIPAGAQLDGHHRPPQLPVDFDVRWTMTGPDETTRWLGFRCLRPWV